MTAAGSLALSGVSKAFGDVVAVQDISLEVEGGKFLTLLGPSGSGKTTTLNLIGGFETLDDGDIRIGGRAVGALPPYRRPVNTVFQGYALFPHLNVFDNVAFGLRMSRTSRREIPGRVRRALEIVRLLPLERRKVWELSGGQQQRVALARAFVNEPSVLLLDEPLSALDAQLRRIMQLELKRIHRELGITFVYVTHDQEEALVMSDLVCVMNGGRIQQMGTPEELYRRPKTAFVARFLGRNNFLEGTLRTGANGALLECPGVGEIRVAGSHGEGPTVITVRPEQLRLCDVGSDETNVVVGRVDGIRFLGDRIETSVEVGGNLRLTVFMNGRYVNEGDAVAIRIPPEACHVVVADAPAPAAR